MAAPLLCDDHRNWIAVDQEVTSPDFRALSLAIQGLGATHHWLRKMEYELVMNGIVEEHDPEMYQVSTDMGRQLEAGRNSAHLLLCHVLGKELS